MDTQLPQIEEAVGAAVKDVGAAPFVEEDASK
jgi:hypothetical protein